MIAPVKIVDMAKDIVIGYAYDMDGCLIFRDCNGNICVMDRGGRFVMKKSVNGCYFPMKFSQGDIIYNMCLEDAAIVAYTFRQSPDELANFLIALKVFKVDILPQSLNTLYKLIVAMRIDVPRQINIAKVSNDEIVVTINLLLRKKMCIWIWGKLKDHTIKFEINHKVYENDGDSFEEVMKRIKRRAEFLNREIVKNKIAQAHTIKVIRFENELNAINDAIKIMYILVNDISNSELEKIVFEPYKENIENLKHYGFNIDI